MADVSTQGGGLAERGAQGGGPAEVARGGAAPRTPVLAGTVLALPVIGLVLLLVRPSMDLRWEHHPSHFWLVLATAALSAVLAYATGAAALPRGDARVLLVSLAFLSAAGFLALHALATPGVLLDHPNTGFVVATPIGLALGSVLALLSSLDFAGERAVRAVRLGRRVRLGLLALMALWLVASLAQLPPLHQDHVSEQARGILAALAIPAIGLYAVAALRYLRLWRRHHSIMLLTMLTAFALVAVGARVQWREERFADLYLNNTVAGTREMSILFADLQGFTHFSENHEPAEVTAMLNAYFQVAVPSVVNRYGGDVDRIIGDALMVTFNKRGDQPDHAVRAAGAGLALQQATAQVAAAHPGWPRFRVGINSGEATVSLLGTEGGRTHTVIGDIVNVASRIEGKAPGGGVAIGPGTKSLLPEAATQSLGRLELKGKAEPLEVHLLLGLTPDAPAAT